jgi:hypothetical protein
MGFHFPRRRLVWIAVGVALLLLQVVFLISEGHWVLQYSQIFQWKRTNLPVALPQLTSPQPIALPLLEWEVESMSENAATRVCQPPNHIPTTCCLGSRSKGLHYEQGVCAKPISVHERLANDTLHYLQPSTRMWQNSKWPQQDCDLCRIIDYLLYFNWTLALPGDSLTRQAFVGLECELHRRGYRVTNNSRRPSQRPRAYGWQYGCREIVTLTVRPNENTNSNSTATIVFYAIYRPGLDNIQMDYIIQNSDVIVFDHGLHWKPSQAQEFREAMTTLLRAFRQDRSPQDQLLDIAQGPQNIANELSNYITTLSATRRYQLVVWRETSAQHFGFPGGHFQHFRKHEVGICFPIEQDTAGFRWTLMEEAAHRNNFTTLNVLDPHFVQTPRTNPDELVLLPYRNYTLPFHYMHPDECTHYCNDPHIWLPIWRGLRIAMDRTVRLLDK